jgi:endonuclease-8
MPEGPTILNLKNKLTRYKGKTVVEATGYGDLDKTPIKNVKLLDVDAFGKNLIFVFKDFFVTVHMGLFGSMLINKRKKVNASFALQFAEAEINFYISKAKIIAGKPQDHFNYKTDILKDEFDGEYVLSTVQEKYADKMIGDVLMEQDLFTGVGNIIRNPWLPNGWRLL